MNPGVLNIDRARIFAVFSIAAGVLSFAVLVASFQPPAVPGQELATFASQRAGYLVLAVVVLTWAVLSTPFVVALGHVLNQKSHSLAQTATILSAAGILLLSFGVFIHVGAMLSIVAAGSPPNPADARYQAAIWTNLGYYLTDPGLMAWGFGQFLFGWLAWRGGVLPNWVSILGMIGGVAGLLTLAVYQTATLALIQIFCFGLWGILTGIVLFRSSKQ